MQGTLNYGHGEQRHVADIHRQLFERKRTRERCTMDQKKKRVSTLSEGGSLPQTYVVGTMDLLTRLDAAVAGLRVPEVLPSYTNEKTEVPVGVAYHSGQKPRRFDLLLKSTVDDTIRFAHTNGRNDNKVDSSNNILPCSCFSNLSHHGPILHLPRNNEQPSRIHQPFRHLLTSLHILSLLSRFLSVPSA